MSDEWWVTLMSVEQNSGKQLHGVAILFCT